MYGTLDSDAKAAIEAELAGLTQRLRSKEVTVRMPPIPSIGNFHTKKTERVDRQRNIFSRFALYVLCPFYRGLLCPFYLDENEEKAGLKNQLTFLRVSESNTVRLENISVQMTIRSNAKIAIQQIPDVQWIEEEIL